MTGNQQSCVHAAAVVFFCVCHCRFTRCITYDHAGVGQSHISIDGSQDRSVDTMAKEQAAVLQGAKVDSDVVLVSTYVCLVGLLAHRDISGLTLVLHLFA